MLLRKSPVTLQCTGLGIVQTEQAEYHERDSRNDDKLLHGISHLIWLFAPGMRLRAFTVETHWHSEQSPGTATKAGHGPQAKVRPRKSARTRDYTPRLTPPARSIIMAFPRQ